MPAREQFYAALYALHERMLQGDPTLLSDVARLVLDPLTQQLHTEFPHEDEQLLLGGAADALLEYGKNPTQANAHAGAGVLGFLVLRAKSRVRDGIRKERRREVAEARFAHGLQSSDERSRGNPVELRRVRTEHDAEGLSAALAAPSPDVEDRLEREAQIELVLASAESDLDRRLLQMLFAGVRGTAEYARVLGIEAEPAEVQEKTVKRHKDRILAAAKRRQEARRSGPKRRGRPPRQRGDDGGNSD
jgi:hypothetical protein